MNNVIATIASILAIAGGAWAANSLLRIRLCPICTGVAGTWLWMIVARHSGFAVDAVMLSTLLGGSVVGIAYQLERHLASGHSPLLWKALFIPAGFAASYGLAVAHWALLAMALLVLILLAAYFLPSRGTAKTSSSAVKKLESEMKNCC